MSNVSKTDFVAELAADLNVSKVQASSFVDSFFSKISSHLKNGDKISFTGFLTLETSVRPARDGRNPQTGAVVKIPKKTVVKAKVGKKLKDSVA